MYRWPLDEIKEALDAPVENVAANVVRDEILAGGYGATLASLLADFYAVANGGTFYGGALRVLPLEGIQGERPSLLGWNEPNDLRSYAPISSRNSFYFLANAFGDLLGVPLNEQNDLARNTTCVLWIEKYSYEESQVGWDEIFPKILTNASSMATFLARLKDYEWAVEGLGRPKADQCFSWKLPPALGGSESLRNLDIGSTYVSLSCSLQLFQQAMALSEQLKGS